MSAASAVQTPVPYQAAARELLRATLLDAGSALLRDRAWSKITMGEVARGAGVSRQTLYSAFGTREEFAQALVLREGDRFLSSVEQAIRSCAPDAERALSAAFEVFLDAAAADPLIRAVVAGDGSNTLLALLTIQGRPLVDRLAERLSEVIVSAWPQASAGEATLLAECMVRLAISCAALPPAAGPRAISSVLAPYARSMVARG